MDEFCSLGDLLDILILFVGTGPFFASINTK